MRFVAILFYLLSSYAHAAPAVEVTFLFYDELGRELSYADVSKRMRNDTAPSLSSGTLDLGSWLVLSLDASEEKNGRWVTTFSGLDKNPRQGLMVHWDTAATGYSSFLVDNGGNGFRETATFVFNERLALDARRQYQEARARKPSFAPSADFTALEARMKDCFDALAIAATPPEKGKRGQGCLDLTAQAMRLLLREYGVQAARAATDARWGVTIHPSGDAPLGDDTAKLDDLADLFGETHRWTRLVMTGTSTKDDLTRIRELVNYATKLHIRPMGQLFDSASQAAVPLPEFKARVDAALSFPDFDKFASWEVGNEVNGGWLGAGMTEKIEYAAEKVKARFPGKPVCLTFYWYGVEDTIETSTFNWIASHITQKIRDHIDCVAMSIYIDQQPLGFSWEPLMAKLAEAFPGKSVMTGEMVFSDHTTPIYYKEYPADWTEEQASLAYIQDRYAASFATPNAVGGGFWWYYDDQMAGKTPRWHALRKLYCETYPGACIPASAL